MGYPMTYRRVVSRNGLVKGDYDDRPRQEWFAWDITTAAASDPAVVELAKHWNAAAAAFNQRVRLLMGDLRRMEHDALDEEAVCASIASKVGLDRDAVAAVLRAFLEV